MRVIVCGSRRCTDYHFVTATLSSLRLKWPEHLVVINGGASGVDRFAKEWALRHGFEVLTFKADWPRYGKAAGPIRNRLMIEQGNPDLVVAFPGGCGTEDMIRQARAANVQVLQIPI